MEKAPSTSSSQNPVGPLYGLYVVAIGIALIGNLVVRMGARGAWLPAWGQTLVGILTVVPLVVAAVLFWRMLRTDLDEMLQRIILEGLAFALTVYVPIAALYVNLRTAGISVPRLDPPDLLFGPAILVAVGIALAWRRFQ